MIRALIVEGFRREAFPCCGLQRVQGCPVCGRRYADRMAVRVWRWRHFRRKRGLLVPRGRAVLWGARGRDRQIVPARPLPDPWALDERWSYRYELGLEFASANRFAILTGITS
jgi:hypothetical protein